MKSEKQNLEYRKNILLEVIGSVITDIHHLIINGDTAEAAKLAEAFAVFPSIVSGSHHKFTIADFCSEIVRKFDVEFQTDYERKVILAAFDSPEAMEKIKHLSETSESEFVEETISVSDGKTIVFDLK